MKNLKKLTVCLMLIMAGCFMLFAPAQALAKTVTVGTGSGSWGDTVSVPITIDNPAGVGGVAFTLTFDPDVFTFAGLEKVTKDVSDGQEYYDAGTGEYVVGSGDVVTVSDTMFFQTNSTIVAGKVLVAAASAKALTDTSLFKAKFTIKDAGDGTYPIGIEKTIILNPAAGYTSPTLIPVLVGMPADQADSNGYYQTSVYDATLVAGSINVSPLSPNLFSISGSVTYADGTNAADGTPVTLKKKVGSNYVFDAQTTVSNGSYSFANNLNGDYGVIVTSTNPNYFSNRADVTVNDADETADIVLPAPVRVSGTLTINTGHLQGLKVKVKDSQGQVVGIFPVNSDGSFQSGPLPPGTYTVYGVYGSLTSDEITTDPYDWNVTLYSISGTVSGLTAGDTVTVSTGSVTGGLLVSVTSDVADGSGNATYTIPNLVPASDYLVSVVGTGLPVIYYDGHNDITQADAVDISSADATGKDFDYTSVTNGTISGTVTENSSPVAAGVFAFDINSFALTSVVSNAGTGDYTLTLVPGSYEVFAILSNGDVFYYSDSGATQNESNATILTIVNAGEELTGKDISITRCDQTLTGNVTFERPGGEPVVNALITAVSADGNSVAMTITGRDGAYTLSGLCSGTVYTVEMNPLGGNFGIQTATITAGTDTTLDFIIDTGNELTGTVRDSGTSTGIANAMIYLIDQDTRTMVGGRMYFSGSDGSYTISDIPTGIYTIVVAHPLYKTTTETDVTIDQDTTKDISMVQGAHFYGTVTDGSNGDVLLPGVLVIVTRAGGTPLYGVTNSSGDYAIYGLDDTKSDYIILAQKRGYQRSVTVNQQPTAQVDITLSLPTATFDLSGTVTSTCNGGTAVPDAQVVVSSSSKKFFAVDTTDQSGGYSFTNLPQSDDYRFVVVPGGDLQVDVTTDLNFTPTNILFNVNSTRDVELPCGSDISGTVTWTGTSKAYVFLYTSANVFVDFTTVDTSGGTYTFKGLTAGNYKVLAVASGNTPEWYNGKTSIGDADPVAAGSTTINIDLSD